MSVLRCFNQKFSLAITSVFPAIPKETFQNSLAELGYIWRITRTRNVKITEVSETSQHFYSIYTKITCCRPLLEFTLSNIAHTLFVLLSCGAAYKEGEEGSVLQLPQFREDPTRCLTHLHWGKPKCSCGNGTEIAKYFAGKTLFIQKSQQLINTDWYCPCAGECTLCLCVCVFVYADKTILESNLLAPSPTLSRVLPCAIGVRNPV